MLSLLIVCLFATAVSTSADTSAGPAAGDVPEIKYPVLLIPGASASQIEGRFEREKVPHFYCEKKTDGWISLWLNGRLLLPGLVDCWIDNFRLVINETTGLSENPAGVETRVPGFGDVDTIEYLSATHLPIYAYFKTMISALVEQGYRRGVNLRAAPYDFRKALNEQEEYLFQVRGLVEKMYRDAGGKRVVVVAHSMGGNFAYYFLLQQTQDWKNKHIKSLVTMGTPYAGVPAALKALTAGETLLLTSRQLSRDFRRSHPTFVYLLPRVAAFGNLTILTIGEEKYTSADMPAILERIGYPLGVKLLETMGKLHADFPHPGVELHCLRGINTPTDERIDYPNESSYPYNPVTVKGEGDGTVNQQSADLCLNWSHASRFHAYTFGGVGHLQLVKNQQVIDYITGTVLKS